MTILALTGHPGSGKTTIAKELLRQHSFERISGSEILKQSLQELQESKRPPLRTRQEFDSYHRQWRKENGIDAMGTFILNRLALNPSQKICFENLRNEHDALRLKSGGVLIVSLQCSLQERYIRVVHRVGGNMTITSDDFRKEEEQEYDSSDPFGSHVTRVMGLADISIDSSQLLEKTMLDLTSALRERGILS